MDELRAVSKAPAGKPIVMDGIAVPRMDRDHLNEAFGPGLSGAGGPGADVSVRKTVTKPSTAARRAEVEHAHQELSGLLAAFASGDAVPVIPGAGRGGSGENDGEWMIGHGPPVLAEAPRGAAGAVAGGRAGSKGVAGDASAAGLEREAALVEASYHRAVAAAERQRADAMRGLLERAVAALRAGEGGTAAAAASAGVVTADSAALAGPGATRRSRGPPSGAARAAARRALGEGSADSAAARDTGARKGAGAAFAAALRPLAGGAAEAAEARLQAALRSGLLSTGASHALSVMSADE